MKDLSDKDVKCSDQVSSIFVASFTGWYLVCSFGQSDPFECVLVIENTFEVFNLGQIEH